MNRIFKVIVLLISATFSTFSIAKDTTPVNQSVPKDVNDQITDSVTQFMRIDTNKDGNISLVEARAAGINEATFRKMDANSDNVIDQKEYQVAILIGE